MGAAMNQTQQIENPTVLIQRAHRWRMAFFGLVILLAGIVIGVAATILATGYAPPEPPPGPEFAADRMVGRLQRDLRLTPDQIDRIRTILERHVQKLQEIRMDARPKIAAELQLMNDEISSVLRHDQRRLWQQHLGRLQDELTRGPIRHIQGPEWRYRGGRQPPDLPPPDEPPPQPPPHRP